MSVVRIGLIGDHDPTIYAHQMIPSALGLAGAAAGSDVTFDWLGTDTLADPATLGARLASYGGLWCVPGSPYASMDGALAAIRCARERGTPFLGTCGGFQHSVIEYARDVLGVAGADHVESNPEAAERVIAPLACALVEQRGAVRFAPGSRIAAIYGMTEAVEGYHCSYGLNPAYADRFTTGALRITGADEQGDARVVELAGHPFFIATLFQPERSAATGRAHPLITAFVAAAARADG
jgi:CTP synthase (UTP-ammonia lyase)